MADWNIINIARISARVELDLPLSWADFCDFEDFLKNTKNWTRNEHLNFGENTQRLFATLFLGIQRLEDTAGLPLAHQAMLEEMLECWDGLDNTCAAYLFQHTFPNDSRRYELAD
jgi:hypothetical protein